MSHHAVEWSSSSVDPSLHEPLPRAFEIEENPDLVRGVPFRTVMGSTVAALAVMPRLLRPAISQDCDDWGAPEQLSDEQVESVPHLFDAVASLCVREDGEAHAIALVAAPERITILHAPELHEAGDPDAVTTELLDRHLHRLWKYLCRESESSTTDTSKELLLYAYRWCWSALYTRFHARGPDIAEGLQKMFDRAFTVSEISAHLHSCRFYSSLSASERELLTTTSQSLYQLVQLITRRSPADDDTILAVHRYLDAILKGWVDPSRDGSDYLLGRLTSTICEPLEVLRDHSDAGSQWLAL